MQVRPAGQARYPISLVASLDTVPMKFCVPCCENAWNSSHPVKDKKVTMWQHQMEKSKGFTSFQIFHIYASLPRGCLATAELLTKLLSGPWSWIQRLIQNQNTGKKSAIKLYQLIVYLATDSRNATYMVTDVCQVITLYQLIHTATDACQAMTQLVRTAPGSAAAPTSTDWQTLDNDSNKRHTRATGINTQPHESTDLQGSRFPGQIKS